MSVRKVEKDALGCTSDTGTAGITRRKFIASGVIYGAALSAFFNLPRPRGMLRQPHLPNASLITND